MKHTGGKCPVPVGTKIDVKFRDGYVMRNVPALEYYENNLLKTKPCYGTLTAFWSHDELDNDIVEWQRTKLTQDAL
jgi:hypothetical protein